jgi:hypothetical protein
MCYKFLLLLIPSLAAAQPALWRSPGAVERLDFIGGPGGRATAPRPPFSFVRPDPSGSAPKARVRDAVGREWSVKWGQEVKAETFASRLAWAAGYFVEPVYYVPKGRIRGVRNPGRAARYLDKDGNFQDARFELIDRSAKYLPSTGWTWKKNPFIDTRPLNGLKIIVMLTSNWDNKDGRDPSSNTAIVRRGHVHGPLIYMVTDWGGSMGKWGNFFTREKWDCEGYAGQSSDFIKAVDGREVKFGFTGQHDGDFKDGITTRDVRWVMRYLGRITDAQIRAGLGASGADAHEQQCFGTAIRQRLNQLRQVSQL